MKVFKASILIYKYTSYQFLTFMTSFYVFRYLVSPYEQTEMRFLPERGYEFHVLHQQKYFSLQNIHCFYRRIVKLKFNFSCT